MPGIKTKLKAKTPVGEMPKGSWAIFLRYCRKKPTLYLFFFFYRHCITFGIDDVGALKNTVCLTL